MEKIADIEDEKKEIAKRPALLPSFIEKATLSGFAEFNYDYVDVTDTEDEDSGSSSDFFISSLELGLRVIFNEWAKTKLVVNAEDVWKDDGEAQVQLDEAIVTLKCPWIPAYFTGGKTVLPFGVFEDHMISGTLTEDLYEIDDVGATLGLAPEFLELDISVTVYEGENIIENIENFGNHAFSPDREKANGLDSYIANLTLEPLGEDSAFGLFYENEPGADRRNQSAGAALTVNYRNFTLDTEFITALAREKGEDDEENKESAWFVALAFQPLKALELATRYEAFYDDRHGDQDEILDDRFLAGFNYSFCDFFTFSFEYRHSVFEKEKDSNAADEQNEFRFQLALEF
ncbi:MAG: LbtU family siderophore porin [Desulfobacterales bacterium]|nr:MAG: LbtU family siderophore porin [Desulfobacterales bacterium]